MHSKRNGGIIYETVERKQKQTLKKMEKKKENQTKNGEENQKTQ